MAMAAALLNTDPSPPPPHGLEGAGAALAPQGPRGAHVQVREGAPRECVCEELPAV